MITDPRETDYQGAYSRNGIRVEFEPTLRGKIVTYYARWCGVRGDVGPWSTPVSMRIAA